MKLGLKEKATLIVMLLITIYVIYDSIINTRDIIGYIFAIICILITSSQFWIFKQSDKK